MKPERDRIFHLRAKALARPATDAAKPTGEEAILVLRTGNSRFGIPLPHVAEVMTNAPVAYVPGVPPRFAGVIQVRGEIRAVLDLTRALDLPGGEPDGKGTIVLLRSRGREMGLVGDQVEDILRVAAADHLPAPTEPPHLSWMTAGQIPVLDIDALLGENA